MLGDGTPPFADPAVYRDLSKPIGALTPERLEKFRKRWTEEGWMYGSHYSNPAVVQLFLLRRIPDAFLHFQVWHALFCIVPRTALHHTAPPHDTNPSVERGTWCHTPSHLLL